jgi:hypothetical protein
MAVFGPSSLYEPRTYEDFFSLWLLTPRARLQWAYAAARGASMVHGEEPEISFEVFDAEALVEAEADEMEAKVNEKRLSQWGKRQAGWKTQHG